MKIVYRVSVNYMEFDFDDHSTADTFALMAKTHAVTDNAVDVKVELLNEEEANK